MGTSNRIRLRNKRPIKRLLIIFLVAFIACFVAAWVAISIYISSVIAGIPNIDDPKIFNLAQTSRIYAADHETVLAELQIENREPVSSLDEISPDLIKATISVEDARFYQHQGVDYLGLFRAALVIASGGDTQGGSTITMQLMRNTVLTKEAQTRSLERKIAEIYLANQFEKKYSKDEILLMYLNTINYGDGCYGIKAASKHYFSKNPDAITLNEAATLAGIPQSPTYLSPTNNPEECTKRRNIVLRRMYDDHIITKEAYDENRNTNITLNVSYRDLNSMYKYPYFTTYVRDQIMENYTKAEIFEGGFQIYTTLDVKHQEATELGCDKANKKIDKDAESVAVTMDPQNGFITSMVGGKDYNENQYNIATSAGRPTGSSFKIFTLITAIEQGFNPYRETVNCSNGLHIGEVTINNINYIDYGTKTIQGAFAVSSNTGFVRLQQKVGGDNVIKTAQKMGIKSTELQNNATLTLGAANINPVDMAAAFSTVANGGIYHEPVCITKIATAQGDTIFEYDQDAYENRGERVLDTRVASAATKVMQTVFTQGTANSAKLNNGQPVAGKTGTSDSYRDHLLVGYTPRLVLATWIGKRNYQPTSSGVNCNYLWKTIMDEITKDEKVEQFVQESDPEYTKKGSSYYYDSDDDYLYNAPNVVGKNIQEAKRLLSNYKTYYYYQFSDTVPQNCIISQNVENGRITLYVSKGKEQ